MGRSPLARVHRMAKRSDAAETYEIRIGARTNIQDFVMIHVGAASPTIVGEDCSITHHATLHGCTIGDRCLIGINATIMDGAKIGNNCIVAGHTIVTEGVSFPITPSLLGCRARQLQRAIVVMPICERQVLQRYGRELCQRRGSFIKEKVDEVLSSIGQ